MDGANAAIRFDDEGTLLLQSRGHYLAGGPRERHFALFKQWANCHAGRLKGALGDRYVLYGEWLYAKHTVFYDLLPHYFLEFDVLDTTTGDFLDTPRRAALLAGLPVRSVLVLAAQPFRRADELTAWVGPSRFVSAGRLERLDEVAAERGLDPARIRRETDPSPIMEGLYLKVEEDGVVRERYKFIRHTFLTAVLSPGDHWIERPIVPNQLAPGVDLFADAT